MPMLKPSPCEVATGYEANFGAEVTDVSKARTRPPRRVDGLARFRSQVAPSLGRPDGHAEERAIEVKGRAGSGNNPLK